MLFLLWLFVCCCRGIYICTMWRCDSVAATCRWKISLLSLVYFWSQPEMFLFKFWWVTHFLSSHIEIVFVCMSSAINVLSLLLNIFCLKLSSYINSCVFYDATQKLSLVYTSFCETILFLVCNEKRVHYKTLK